ncbi:MAG TPA: hypothetical protein VFL62_15925, partial [Bradyrhizobium sp.]|uniref:hypothetical protein n=1 Tax=Bradyrhizobium sp. TaxID=376 RepID=UPI002D7EE0C3
MYGFPIRQSRDGGENSDIAIAAANSGSTFIVVQRPLEKKIFYGLGKVDAAWRWLSRRKAERALEALDVSRPGFRIDEA